MIKRLFFALAMLAFAVFPARAGDATSPFAGAYIGVAAGYAGDTVSGWQYGSKVGYNFDLGRGFIVGAEGDVYLSTASTTFADGEATVKIDQKWQASLRGRLGYTVGDWLPYATAGLAWGHFKAIEDGDAAEETARLWVSGLGLDYHIPGTNMIAGGSIVRVWDGSFADGITEAKLSITTKLN